MSNIAKNIGYTLALLLGITGGLALAIAITFYMLVFGTVMYFDSQVSEVPSTNEHSAYQESVNPQETINAEKLQRR